MAASCAGLRFVVLGGQLEVTNETDVSRPGLALDGHFRARDWLSVQALVGQAMPANRSPGRRRAVECLKGQAQRLSLPFLELVLLVKRAPQVARLGRQVPRRRGGFLGQVLSFRSGRRALAMGACEICSAREGSPRGQSVAFTGGFARGRAKKALRMVTVRLKNKPSRGVELPAFAEVPPHPCC